MLYLLFCSLWYSIGKNLFNGETKEKIGFELHIPVHDVFPENTRPAGLKLPMYCLFKHIFDKVYTKADQLIILGRNMANVLEQKVGKGGGES